MTEPNHAVIFGYFGVFKDAYVIEKLFEDILGNIIWESYRIAFGCDLHMQVLFILNSVMGVLKYFLM